VLARRAALSNACLFASCCAITPRLSTWKGHTALLHCWALSYTPFANSRWHRGTRTRDARHCAAALRRANTLLVVGHISPAPCLTDHPRRADGQGRTAPHTAGRTARLHALFAIPAFLRAHCAAAFRFSAPYTALLAIAAGHTERQACLPAAAISVAVPSMPAPPRARTCKHDALPLLCVRAFSTGRATSRTQFARGQPSTPAWALTPGTAHGQHWDLPPAAFWFALGWSIPAGMGGFRHCAARALRAGAFSVRGRRVRLLAFGDASVAGGRWVRLRALAWFRHQQTWACTRVPRARLDAPTPSTLPPPCASAGQWDTGHYHHLPLPAATCHNLCRDLPHAHTTPPPPLCSASLPYRYLDWGHTWRGCFCRAAKHQLRLAALPATFSRQTCPCLGLQSMRTRAAADARKTGGLNTTRSRTFIHSMTAAAGAKTTAPLPTITFRLVPRTANTRFKLHRSILSWFRWDTRKKSVAYAAGNVLHAWRTPPGHLPSVHSLCASTGRLISTILGTQY